MKKTAEEFWKEKESVLIEKMGLKLMTEEKVYFASEMWNFMEEFASQSLPSKEMPSEFQINDYIETFKKGFSGSVDYLSGVNDASYSLLRKLIEKQTIEIFYVCEKIENNRAVWWTGNIYMAKGDSPMWTQNVDNAFRSGSSDEINGLIKLYSLDGECSEHGYMSMPKTELSAPDKQEPKTVFEKMKAKGLIAEGSSMETIESHSDQMIDRMNEETITDLKQYVTNLLYHAKYKTLNMNQTQFDEWVISEWDNIDAFFKSNQSLKQTDVLLKESGGNLNSDYDDGEEPKHPTSWRDFTMTDKVETPDKAIIEDAEKLLYDTMYENGFTYVSFPAFVENESSVDVFDIACKAIEKFSSLQIPDKLSDEQIEEWIKETYPELNIDERSLMLTAAEAYRDGSIAEWVKNNK